MGTSRELKCDCASDNGSANAQNFHFMRYAPLENPFGCASFFLGASLSLTAS
jgi:hypothetical protein